MLVQQYQQYTDSDHHVWRLLYTRQMQAIGTLSYKHFAKSIHDLKFQETRIPEFSYINEKLKELTGWQIYAVPGLIPNDHFFKQMFLKKFGATTWIRKMEELDYLEEPDMFHDVFGHLALLADPVIASYLYGLAKLAVEYIDRQEVIESIARLYWYTIEFGLVKENDEIKIYGAGLLSSIGESRYCLSDKAALVPFNLDQVLQTPYIKDKFQEKYFVLESMDQLTEVVEELQWKL